MPKRFRPFATARRVALLLLVTAAAAWLWAHEGHEPLPTRGAKALKDSNNRVVGVVLSAEAREALGLQTAPVEKRSMAGRVLAYASLTATWQGHAFATSRLPGRVVKVHVRAGQTVRAGQLLAELQSAELESLQLELLTAQSDARLSEKLLASLKESYEKGSASEQALADARTRHQQNLNARQVSRAKWLSLGLAEADLDRLFKEGKPVVAALPVRSQVKGTVIHADLSVGKVVEPTEHLFEVVDLSTVWVRIGVLERDLHRVKEGQEVELTLPAHPGETFRCRVQVRGLHLDPRAHLNTVWAELANPEGPEPRFLPGMNGQAHLLTPAPASTVVPARSVLHDGVESYVLVEGSRTAEGSEYLRIPIAVGRRTEEWVEAVAGDVFPGSHVVTRGSHELAGFFVPGVLRLSPEARREIDLKVEKVGPHAVDRIVHLEGAVDVPPDRRAVVSAQVSGTLHEVLVERGQEVKAGQELARVASLELQTLQLELLKAHLELGLAEATLKRLRSAKASAPPRALWEAETRANSLRQQRDSARRKLTALGLSSAQVRELLEKKKLVPHLPLRSAIAGRVVQFDKVRGQALKADDALFEVHDLSRPLIQGFVSEADLAFVRTGQKARVRLTADPAFVGEGTVVRGGRVFGADSRTLSIWVELDRPPSRPLLHNQLARLTIVRGRATTGLAVPLGAVAREGARAFVFVLLDEKAGTFERRAVETGVEDDRRVIITRGLSADKPETIAVSGTAALMTAHAAVR